MNTNLFIPPQLSCSKHGQHQKGWLTFHVSPNLDGIYQTTHICGLCIIETLQRIGYTVTEPEGPEALKEDAWVLDEMPEVRK